MIVDIGRVGVGTSKMSSHRTNTRSQGSLSVVDTLTHAHIYIYNVCNVQIYVDVMLAVCACVRGCMSVYGMHVCFACYACVHVCM